jgi:hypothetical protein
MTTIIWWIEKKKPTANMLLANISPPMAIPSSITAKRRNLYSPMSLMILGANKNKKRFMIAPPAYKRLISALVKKPERNDEFI